MEIHEGETIIHKARSHLDRFPLCHFASCAQRFCARGQSRHNLTDDPNLPRQRAIAFSRLFGGPVSAMGVYQGLILSPTRDFLAVANAVTHFSGKRLMRR